MTLFDPPPERSIPDQALPEMTLRASTFDPPIVLFDAALTQMPSSPFAMANVPVALVPM